MLAVYLALLDDDEDRRQFLALHRAYEAKLYWVAKSYLHQPSLAEEAVQQAWLQIIKNFAKIKAVSWDKTEAYVVIVVKNVCKDILRREKKYTELPEDWDIPEPDSAHPPGELERLVQIIRSMPDRYRLVLEMKFVLEYSNRDIAKALGIKESTVATQVERGRKLLIARLREEGYDRV